MQRITSWAEFEPKATEAEKQLKEAVESNKICKLGPKDQIPPRPIDWLSPESSIHVRAEVIRFLITDGNGIVQTEAGLKLQGACISGKLDLSDAVILRMVSLWGCRFQKNLYAQRSHWRSLVRFDTCSLPGFDAASAVFDGQLVLSRSSIYRPKSKSNPGIREGNALFLQRAEIKGSLFLKSTSIRGTAQLNGICIQGNLHCNGARFSNTDATCLSLESAEIGGAFFCARNVRFEGEVNLTASHFENLEDDPLAWPSSPNLKLDGCTYNRVAGVIDTKSRLCWLEKGSSSITGDFQPQPYKQLAKVINQMGHEHNAREINYALAEKLERQRLEDIRKELQEPLKEAPKLGKKIGLTLYFLWLHVWTVLIRYSVGFGWKPFRSLGVLIALITGCWVLSIGAWHAGDFAPNSPVLLLSKDWERASEFDNPAEAWSDSIAAKDWETFHSLAYAFDVVIPIIDFGQTEAWAPSTERSMWGIHLWWTTWFFTAFGWIVTTLGAAAIGGIIRRE